MSANRGLSTRELSPTTGKHDREWGWQWVFPASSHFADRRNGIRHPHHLHESVIQKAVRDAVVRSGPRQVRNEPYVTTPSDQMSLRWSMVSPRNCSGDM